MKKHLVISAILMAGFFVSCGDDSTSMGPDGELSSSSVVKSSSSIKAKSSSSKLKSSSSVKAKSSSSVKAKSSSAVVVKSSSSVTAKSSSAVAKSSSSVTAKSSSAVVKSSSSAQPKSSSVTPKSSSVVAKSSSSVTAKSSSSVVQTSSSAQPKSSSVTPKSSSVVAESSSSVVKSSSSAQPKSSSVTPKSSSVVAKSSSSSTLDLGLSSIALSSSSEEEVSSSSVFTTWSWDIPKETIFNSKIRYGTLVDSRDNHVYRTVTIGQQVWMAENLNYADSVRTESLKGKSWCYNDLEENCNLGGRLYSWAAAIDSVKLANDISNPQNCGYDQFCELSYPLQGICPNGWHVPNNDDWIELIQAISPKETIGKQLKSQTGWNSDKNGVSGNGSDDYGFSAIPVGGRYQLRNSQGFMDDGKYAYFWSASEWDVRILGHADENNDGSTHIFGMQYNDDRMMGTFAAKRQGMSIRCVKD